MSQDIGMTPNPRSGFGVLQFPGWTGCSGWWAWWASGGLVVAGRVEGEFAEQLAGGGVDDADVQVLDEQQGSGVGSADADVVELAAVAQGDAAVGVEPVGADPVVGVGRAVAGSGLGARGVGMAWWAERGPLVVADGSGFAGGSACRSSGVMPRRRSSCSKPLRPPLPPDSAGRCQPVRPGAGWTAI
jgi:hypothetical protein